MILIVGGTGALGIDAALRLLAKGTAVRILQKRP
jgi:nucleoside-diphosphate-sugar epimerase